ncbi:hypothetical protein [Daejeonella sp.]|uniref:hypothetical protein n=1 Tax=Daejeonella sp. TaxID=2805397 RepID=UPI0030BC37E0
MKNILLIIITSLLFTACEKNNTSPPQFRIQNRTPFTIESATVKLGTSTNTYPTINAGEVSEFKVFSDYDYPDITLRINGKDLQFTIQPFEGGSTGNGKTIKETCVITYNAGSDRFSVHFSH